MFDLGQQTKVPSYELKLVTGETKVYDAIVIGFQLRELEGEDDPGAIQKVICRVFDVTVDALAAMQIADDFVHFAEEHLEEPLKNVFGRASSSTTSTDSRPDSTPT